MKVCVTRWTSRTQAPFFGVEESEYEAIRKLIELFVRNYLFRYCLIQSSLIPRLLPCPPPKNNNFAGEEPGYEATFKN